MQGVPKQVLITELPKVCCVDCRIVSFCTHRTHTYTHTHTHTHTHTQTQTHIHTHTHTHTRAHKHTQTHTHQLLPLLLESLSSDEIGLKVSTLQGLLSLIEDTPQSVIEHVPTLVPRLLTLARDKASMVRFNWFVQYHVSSTSECVWFRNETKFYLCFCLQIRNSAIFVIIL